MRRNFLCLLMYVGFASCNVNSGDTIPSLVSLSTFDSNLQNWTAGTAGYPLSKAANYKFDFEYGNFTTSPGYTYPAAVQSAYVDSAVVFTYIKNRIGGLEPNTQYDVYVRVQLYVQLLQDYTGNNLGDVTKGCFLKTGLFTDEPQNDTLTVDSVPGKTFIDTKFDRGAINADGADLFFLNKIDPIPVNGSPIVFESGSDNLPIQVTSDNDGHIWGLVGLDTNIKIYFKSYYHLIEFTFVKKPG